METSINIAAIVGPVLMLISLTEFMNFKIWLKVEPTVVYLNGTLLFVGGLAIIRAHNSWEQNWTVLITIVGWMALILGLVRSFFPLAKQPSKSFVIDVILLLIFLTGTFLTVKSYFGS